MAKSLKAAYCLNSFILKTHKWGKQSSEVQTVSELYIINCVSNKTGIKSSLAFNLFNNVNINT